MNDELRMRIQQPGSQGLLKIVEEVLSSLIHADLLYFDGQVPHTFHEDASEGAQALLTRNIDAPSVRYMPDPEARGVVLACVAPRSLPISSAHCGRPFKLAFLIANKEVVTTSSFFVFAKQPKADAGAIRGGIRPRQGAARLPRYLRSETNRQARAEALEITRACLQKAPPDHVGRRLNAVEASSTATSATTPTAQGVTSGRNAAQDAAEAQALKSELVHAGVSSGMSVDEVDKALAQSGVLPDPDAMQQLAAIPLQALPLAGIPTAVLEGSLEPPPDFDFPGMHFRGASVLRHLPLELCGPRSPVDAALFFLRRAKAMIPAAALWHLDMSRMTHSQRGKVIAAYGVLRKHVVRAVAEHVSGVRL